MQSVLRFKRFEPCVFGDLPKRRRDLALLRHEFPQAIASLFEPSGVVQQEYFAAGTPVLAFKTGGLKDTVFEFLPQNEEGNGFTFGPIDHGHFSSALDRALGLFQHFPADWKLAAKRGMLADHSWEHVAEEYIALYQGITFA